MKQNEIEKYIRNLDEVISFNEPHNQNLSKKGLRILKEYRKGSYRGHYKIGKVIINMYRITKQDLKELEREKNRFYTKNYMRGYRLRNKDKLKQYYFNYYKKNKKKLDEYNKSPIRKKKRNERAREMRRVYKNYLAEIVKK